MKIGKGFFEIEKSDLSEVDHENFLCSLFLFSRGNNFFQQKKPHKILECLKNKTYSDEINKFKDIIYLSLKIGSDIPNTQPPYPTEENYCSKDNIVSAFEDKIIIRHALGTTIFSVEEMKNEKHKSFLKDIPHDKSPKRHILRTTKPCNYKSQFSESDKLKDFQTFEDLFPNGNDRYTEYTNQPITHTNSSAHHLLSDISYLSLFSDIRYLSPTQHDEVASLDTLTFQLSYSYPVYQVQRTGTTYTYAHSPTPRFTQFLSALNSKTPDFLKFTFTECSDDPSTNASLLASSDTAIIFNETDLLTNPAAREGAPSRLVVTPAHDSSHYTIDVDLPAPLFGAPAGALAVRYLVPSATVCELVQCILFLGACSARAVFPRLLERAAARLDRIARIHSAALH